jgi:hypothetical protein
MKHRNIRLTEKQELAFLLAMATHDAPVHFVWYPHNAHWSGTDTMDEFIEDQEKVQIGELLVQSWSGSPTVKSLPVWERIEDYPDGKRQWKNAFNIEVDLVTKIAQREERRTS